MASHPTPVSGTGDDSATGQLLHPDDAPADGSGNAGPDCFWLPGGTRPPAPRIAAVRSLDQQPKPPRPALSS